MPTPKRRKSDTNVAPTAIPALTPTHAQIAERAYKLFCDRGGQHGQEDGDWLQAERELRAELVEAAAGV